MNILIIAASPKVDRYSKSAFREIVDFRDNILKGIRDCLDIHGYGYELDTSFFSIQKFVENKEYLKYSGILMLDHLTDEKEIHSWNFLTHLVPTVSLITGYCFKEGAYVSIDNKKAMKILVEHLKSEGHKKIGYICTKSDSNKTVLDRESGFLRALQENGMEIFPDSVFSGYRYPELSSDFKEYEQHFYEIYDSYIKKNRSIDAICFFSDLQANLFIEYAQNHSIRIPEDIAITGFDNIDKGKNRFLTTIHYDFYITANRAALLLIQIIRKQKDPNEHVSISPVLIIGKSSLKKTLNNISHIDFFSNTLRYIEENLYNSDVTGELAEKLEITRKHFKRKFIKCFGVSIVTYLNKKRVAKAAGDLLSTHKSILNISIDCGFKTLRQFNRVFHSTYNLPPGSYRKLFGRIVKP